MYSIWGFNNPSTKPTGLCHSGHILIFWGQTPENRAAPFKMLT